MLATLRQSLGFVIGVLSIVAAIVLGLLVLERLDRRPRTDDAYIQADLVHMAPDVSGRVVEFDIRDNQAVHAGDVLFRIDPEPFDYKVRQAQAQVRMLEARLGDEAGQVAGQAARADAAQSGVLSAEAALTQATMSLARMQPLLARGYVSAEQVDQARSSQRSAQIALLQARQQAQGAQADVASVAPTEAQLEGARAELASAERDLRNTVVHAPCDGRITGLEIAAGEYAATGRTLFTIIDTEHWYAVGNFREIDFDGLREGLRATIYALSDPHRPFAGTVDGLGWGVRPDEGSTSTGLPSVPRSLEWVRIAQRFPVRVLLENPPADLMRVGASAVIILDR